MPEELEVVRYRTIDVGGTRIHHWAHSDVWAIGNGPIEYVTREEAVALLRKLWPNKKQD